MPSLENLFEGADQNIFKSLTAAEKTMLANYKKVLTDINAELSNLMVKFGSEWTDINRGTRLLKLENAIRERVKEALGTTVRFTDSTIIKAFKDSFHVTEIVIGEALQIPLSFEQLNVEAIRKLVENPFDRVKWKWKGRSAAHHAAAVDQVKSVITQGLIKGQGYAATARDVKTKINTLANNQIRIVRTESHRSQVLGRVEGIKRAEPTAKKFGFETERVLSSAMDDRTREQSIEMDGQIADADGLFTYPNGVKALPGSTGVPEYDINDREQVILRLKKDTKKPRVKRAPAAKKKPAAKKTDGSGQ